MSMTKILRSRIFFVKNYAIFIFTQIQTWIGSCCVGQERWNLTDGVQRRLMVKKLSWKKWKIKFQRPKKDLKKMYAIFYRKFNFWSFNYCWRGAYILTSETVRGSMIKKIKSLIICNLKPKSFWNCREMFSHFCFYCFDNLFVASIFWKTAVS